MAEYIINHGLTRVYSNKISPALNNVCLTVLAQVITQNNFSKKFAIYQQATLIVTVSLVFGLLFIMMSKRSTKVGSYVDYVVHSC